MRVNNTMLFRTALTDLNQISKETDTLLRQSGTGRRYARASEEPVAALRAMRLRTEDSRQQAIIASLQQGIDDLSAAEQGVEDAISVFQRAKEIGIQAASGALSDNDFEAIATEAESLLASLLDVANRKVEGRYLFSGTESATQPFVTTGDPPTSVSYNGNSDSRTVSPSSSVDFVTNLPGDDVFQSPVDVFDALIQLRDAARSHDITTISGSVSTALEASLNSLIDARTEVGGLQAGLTRSAEGLEVLNLDTQASLSEAEDADLVEILTQLEGLETRRTAMLQTAARVVQPSLMDYLA